MRTCPADLPAGQWTHRGSRRCLTTAPDPPPMEPVIVTSKTQLAEAVEAAVERAVSRLAPRFRVDERDRPSKAFLTNAEAQAYLGLSKATLARYRADGTLPYSKVGANVYYRLSDLEALLEENVVGAQKGNR